MVETFQSLCQIVKLIDIDKHTLKALEKGRTVFDADDPTVIVERVADLHLLQQSKRVVIFFPGDRQWDSDLTVTWSICVSDNYVQYFHLRFNYKQYL